MSDQPSSPRPTTAPALEQAIPSLRELRDQAQKPGADLEELDALLMGMDRPRQSDEEARERADVLHLIIEDPWLGGFRGSDRRRLDETAARALVDLGEPYASKLSPRGRELLGQDVPSAPPVQEPTLPPPEAYSSFQQVGAVLTLLLGALELILAAAFNDVALHLLLPFTGVYVALTTLLPVLLMVRSPPSGSAFVAGRGIVIFAVLPWGLIGALFYVLGRSVTMESMIIPLMLVGRVVAVICLLRDPPTAPDAPSKTPDGA